jgi:sugar lactone lactonase YvrE
LITLLHDNETKAVQHCCVVKERNNAAPVHCYAAGHRRHDATETITRNNIFPLFSVGGGVSLVIPVNGTGTQKLLTTRGHDVILLNWNQENATFDSTVNSTNVSVIATVETSADKSGNRWNDGKADAEGRLWAGM